MASRGQQQASFLELLYMTDDEEAAAATSSSYLMIDTSASTAAQEESSPPAATLKAALPPAYEVATSAEKRYNLISQQGHQRVHPLQHAASPQQLNQHPDHIPKTGGDVADCDQSLNYDHLPTIVDLNNNSSINVHPASNGGCSINGPLDRLESYGVPDLHVAEHQPLLSAGDMDESALYSATDDSSLELPLVIKNETSKGSRMMMMMMMRPVKNKKTKKVPQPSIALQTRSDTDILDDGFRWRKYGQKAVKHNTHPRSYYRCTHSNCTVKKRVERCLQDPGIVMTTYQGTHNHECALAGTAPSAFSSSSSSTHDHHQLLNLANNATNYCYLPYCNPPSLPLQYKAQLMHPNFLQPNHGPLLPLPPSDRLANPRSQGPPLHNQPL